MILVLHYNKKKKYPKGKKKDESSEEEILFNKYLRNGENCKRYLKNCKSTFEKQKHIDMMCMAKSLYTRGEMAAELKASPDNIKIMIKEIFIILEVSTMQNAVAKLAKK